MKGSGSWRKFVLMAWVGVVHSAISRADTTATWVAGASGTWNNPVNWSTNPNYPNDGTPSGAAYQVAIDEKTGSAYTVSLASNIAVDGLVLNSPDATLQQTGGILDLHQQTIDLKAGTFVFGGGKIQNARIQSEGGIITSKNLTGTVGTLNNVILAAPLELTTSNPLNFQNHLTLDGVTMSLVSADSGGFGATLAGVGGDVFIDGSGTVALDGGSYNVISSPNTLTIGSGVTITTRTGSGTLGRIDGSFVNQGTIYVTRNRLYITGAWQNQGTIHVDGGALWLLGKFSTAGLGNIVQTAGDVEIAGALDNTGAILDLDKSGSLALGGSIIGGRITSSGPSKLYVNFSSTMSGVELDADLEFVGNSSGQLTIENGLHLIGNHTITLAAGSSLDISQITGSGRIIANGLPNSSGYTSTIAGSLTAGLTLSTGAPGALQVRYTGESNLGLISARTADIILAIVSTQFTNLSTMEATDGILAINAQSWTNNGTLVVSGNGVLQFGGNVTTSGLGLARLSRTGGTIEITGTLINTNDTLPLSAATGSINLHGGTILGGAVTVADGAELLLPAQYSGTLDGVRLETDLTVNDGAALNVLNGLTLPTGQTISLSSGAKSSSINFNGAPQEITGNGQIRLDGTSSSNVVGGSGPLTIGNGIAIRTGMHGGTISGPSLTNKGIISAETSGQTLAVNSASFSNQGSLAVTAGTLAINSSNWNNVGTLTVSGTGLLQIGGTVTTAGLGLAGLNRTGGTIEITGTLINSNDALALSPATGSFALHGGTIKGGNITAAGGAALLLPASSSGTLDGVQLSTDIIVSDGAQLSVSNGLTFSGGRIITLTGGSNPARLNFSGGPQTISGTGQVILSGTSSADIITGATATIGPDIQIRTGTRSGIISVQNLTNQGIISAETPGQNITVFSPVFVNQGTLAVSAGSTMTAYTGISGGGTVSVDALSTLRANYIRQKSLKIGGNADDSASSGRVFIYPKGLNGATSTVESLDISKDASGHSLGLLDLADTALIVNYSSQSVLPAVRDEIIQGYNGGTWTGNGISSSSAKSDLSRALGYAEASETLGANGGLFAGQPADGSAVLVRYTLRGDANLDGKVDFKDLVVVAQNYKPGASVAGDSWWGHGDFNYDGVVDFSDLVSLAQNYGGATPGGAVPGVSPEFDAAMTQAFAPVPEPSFPMWMVVTGALFLRRRDRRPCLENFAINQL